jgi:hypothetical protein
MLCSDIENLEISDSKNNIKFDCKNELNICQRQIDKMLKSLVFDYKGTFGQNTYNQINDEIDLRISQLSDLINECDLIKADFTKKKTDYNSFLSYLIYYDNSKDSFNEFKNQIISYLKSNIETISSELFTEANKKILGVEFTKPKSNFYLDFNSNNDSEKQLIVDHVMEKENLINAIRSEISDKFIDKFQDSGGNKKNQKSEELNNVSEKIKSLIQNCNDVKVKKIYKAKFDELNESRILKDIYFFKELHDSIFDLEKTRRTKVEINEILSELNTTSFHFSTNTEKQNLINSCLNLLNYSNITKNMFDEIKLKYEQLDNLSKKHIEEDEVKYKEHLFLKSQVIHCLENQGYEVIDDLEVIDFEKENDFLLKINGQDNYLNLKFKEDGSMRYVFQIPENKDELSTDQKNLKLHEMEVTCSEFQSILNDLSMMGLKINMRSERPIELDSIVSITKKEKEKLKSKSKNQDQKSQLRKKYLN